MDRERRGIDRTLEPDYLKEDWRRRKEVGEGGRRSGKDPAETYWKNGSEKQKGHSGERAQFMEQNAAESLGDEN